MLQKFTYLMVFCAFLSYSSIAQKLYVSAGVFFEEAFKESTDFPEKTGVHPEVYLEYEGSFNLKHKWTVGINWWNTNTEASTDIFTFDDNQNVISDCLECPDDWQTVDVKLNYLAGTASYRYEVNTAVGLDLGWVLAFPLTAKASYQQPTQTNTANIGIINEPPFTSLESDPIDQYSMLNGPSFGGVYKFNRLYTAIYCNYLFGNMPLDPISESGTQKTSFLQFKLRIGYRLI